MCLAHMNMLGMTGSRCDLLQKVSFDNKLNLLFMKLWWYNFGFQTGAGCRFKFRYRDLFFLFFMTLVCLYLS